MQATLCICTIITVGANRQQAFFKLIKSRVFLRKPPPWVEG